MFLDTAGNNGACVFDVTIIDEVSPTATCLDITKTVPSGPSGNSIPNYNIMDVSDNVDVTSDIAIQCNPPEGSVFLLGSTTVTCTLLDTAGNSGSCIFGVTIRDILLLQQFIITCVNWQDEIDEGMTTTSSFVDINNNTIGLKYEIRQRAVGSAETEQLVYTSTNSTSPPLSLYADLNFNFTVEVLVKVIDGFIAFAVFKMKVEPLMYEDIVPIFASYQSTLTFILDIGDELLRYNVIQLLTGIIVDKQERLDGNNILQRTKRQTVTSWTTWIAWSPCSRSCGGGVSTRTRQCITRYRYTLRHASCLGEERQYRACNWQECPRGSRDFRELQCTLYNGRQVLGQVAKDWVPYLDVTLPCQLQCYSRDRWFYYNFGQVLDGTTCNTEDRDMCVGGICVHVGCDGVLGSNKTEDACRVCGGDGSTCIHHQNTYVKEFPTSGLLGYNKVATIPKGATYLEIIDTSRNYLALMKDDDYLLNGNWIINWPGKYKAVGTSIHYQRTPDDHERIAAAGPTSHDLQLMVLFRERNPGITYEYWLPNELHSLQNRAKNITETKKEDVKAKVQESKHEQHDIPDIGAESNGQDGANKKVKTDTNKKRKQTDSSRKKQRGRSNPGSTDKKKCPKCRKVRGDMKTHFCNSGFVSHIRVLAERQVNDQIRYDVTVIQTYRNRFNLSHREFLWVQSTCRCPRLRFDKEYVIMGSLSTNFDDKESRLLISAQSYVRKWKRNMHEKLDILQRDSPCTTSTMK
ncbi:ADAMTS-like protein 5 [Glandiceps talaboti]